MAKRSLRTDFRRGRSAIVAASLAGLLGIAGGGTLVMGTSRTVPGAAAGDWLAFSGALLGVMFSIAAAVWIEDRKRAAEESEQVALVYDALENLRLAFQHLDEPRPEADSMEGLRIVTILEHFSEAMETLTFMRQHVRVADVLVWRQIRAIERHVGADLSRIEGMPNTAARVKLPVEELRATLSALAVTASVARPLLLHAMHILKARI